jgi:hypothetical protein
VEHAKNLPGNFRTDDRPGPGPEFLFISACRIVELPQWLLFWIAAPRQSASDTLYGFYDLSVEPVSFDFLWFLTGAEAARIRHGLSQIHVVIVPGPEDGFRAEDRTLEAALDKTSRRWRVQNILAASTALLPSVAGYTICMDRRQARLLRRTARHFYPNCYRVAAPVAHAPIDTLSAAREGGNVSAIRATEQSLRYVDQWLDSRFDGRRSVSITFREYKLSTARNNDIDAWIAFARRISENGFFPIIVRATEEALARDDDRFKEFEIFAEAAWNVALRSALYQRCYLNLGVNTGPMLLCWLNDQTRSLTFKMSSEDAAGTSHAVYRVRGFEPGQTPDLANP